MFREKPARAVNGWPVLGLLVVVMILSVVVFIGAIAKVAEPGGIPALRAMPTWLVIPSLLVGVITGGCFAGFTLVSPNEARVIQLLGSYIGSVREPGFWYVNPIAFPRERVSQRIRNFESSKLKVNDHAGNPIEIAAVVVWKVVDTAEAVFQVDQYGNFVQIQTEAAVRNLATSYPYDTNADGELALRRNNAEISEKLRGEIQDRLSRAGIEVIEARISHLAYAPEIAGAMLRRQQAGAIVAARTRIVEGAVGMVEMALDELAKKKVVDLDPERKAAMVSNLMVVLCSDQHTQPIVNAGTLYQ